MSPLVEFFGRLHPMVLHAPIGLLIALVALEAFAAVRRRQLAPEVRSPLAWLVALSAAGAAGTGFVLGRSGEFGGDLVDLHRILGIGAALACVVAAVVQQRAGARGAYFAMLAVATGAVVIAGHKGAAVTHGENYLWAPFEKEPLASKGSEPAPVDAAAAPETPTAGAEPSQFVRAVRPILEQRCYSCHGPEKRKGGLRLHTPDDIRRGGDFGPIVIAGNPAVSEIVRRVRLDESDDECMPPEGKARLSEAEIKAIEDWIAGGAAMEDDPPAGKLTNDAAIPAETSLDDTAAATAPPSGPREPDASAIAALRAKFVHVAPIAAGSPLLAIDLGVAPGLSEPDAVSMLHPLLANIAELSAARCAVGDALAALCAQMPRLRMLDLSATAVTTDGVAALKDHPALEELVLTRTRLGDASMDAIASIESLQRIYLWNSGVSTEGAASLRAARPGLTIDLGEPTLAAAIESEQEIKLTSDAPVPGAPPAAPTSLKPVNAVCPVSGEAVSTSFLLVHKERVVGFCCRHCLGKFLEDPAAYEAKIQ